MVKMNRKAIGDKYFAKWIIRSEAKKRLAFNYEEDTLICITMDGYYHKMEIA